MEITLAQLNEAGNGTFPGLVGVEVDEAADGRVRARLPLRPEHLAPNGYLHAGAVITLADTACGYGCILSLPAGGIGFTTVELKTNFLRSARTGTISCEATPRARRAHDAALGRNGQRRRRARDGALPLHPARAAGSLGAGSGPAGGAERLHEELVLLPEMHADQRVEPVEELLHRLDVLLVRGRDLRDPRRMARWS